MSAPRPSVAFESMRRTGLLEITCPELIATLGVEPGEAPGEDAYQRALRCLDACTGTPLLRIAALLHDVGKGRSPGDHARVGAEMAEAILNRLKCSNVERARVTALIRHHEIGYSSDWTDAALRRWIRLVTPDLAPDLYELCLAIARTRSSGSAEVRALEELRERVTRLLTAGVALSTRDLKITGRDLMLSLDLAPSRLIGETLEHLLELVTDDPSLNEPAALLAAARAKLGGEAGKS